MERVVVPYNICDMQRNATYDTKQCTSILSSAIHSYTTTQCNTIKCNAAQCMVLQQIKMQDTQLECNAVKCDTKKSDSIQPNEEYGTKIQRTPIGTNMQGPKSRFVQTNKRIKR